MPIRSIDDHDEVTIQWRFIYQTLSGTSYLHFLEILSDDKGSTVLEKLRKEYYGIKAQSCYSTWDKMPYFWKPVIEIVTISENSVTDPESQNGNRRVLISNRERDSELTTAFGCPEILTAAESFVQRNARFAVHSPLASLQDDRQAIMIGQELKRLGLWVLVLTMMVFYVCLGVLVGILTKSIDLGVAVTSGLATITACLQVFGFQAQQ